MGTIIQNKNERNNVIDLFRIIAAFMVVAIHTHPFYDISSKLGYVVCQVLVRVAVPFFFVVSGYFYFVALKKHGAKYCFLYIKRLIIEYGIWSLIYYIIDFINLESGASIISFFKSRIVNFCIFGSHYHLWFYPALIISVAIMTLFYIIRKEKILYIISIPLYILGCVCTTYSNLIPSFNEISFFSSSWFESIRRIFMMGLPFCVLGGGVHWLSSTQKYDKRTLWLILCVLCYAVEIVIIRLLSCSGIILTITLYPLTAVIFLWALNAKAKLPLASTYRECSTNIYFVHPLIISLLGYLLIDWGYRYKITIIWLLTCIFSILIACAIYFCKKIIMKGWNNLKSQKREKQG